MRTDLQLDAGPPAFYFGKTYDMKKQKGIRENERDS